VFPLFTCLLLYLPPVGGGILCCCQQGAAPCWFCSSDRLIGDDKELCDENCVAEARVLGLMFSVGRLLHSITQTMQAAAKPFKLGHKTRLLDTAADSVSSSTFKFLIIIFHALFVH